MGLLNKDKTQTKFNHTTSVSGLIANQEDIISYDKSGKIIIRELKKRTIKQQIQAHSGEINSLIFHPSGKFFATNSNDEKIKIWEISDYNLISEFDIGNKGKALSFAPSGNLLFSNTFENLKSWSLKDQKLYGSYFHKRYIDDSFAFFILSDGEHCVFVREHGFDVLNICDHKVERSISSPILKKEEFRKLEILAEIQGMDQFIFKNNFSELYILNIRNESIHPFGKDYPEKGTKISVLPNGKDAIVLDERLIYSINIETKEKIYLDTEGETKLLSLSHNGEFLLTTQGNKLELRHFAKNWNVVAQFHNESPITCGIFIPDLSQVAFGDNSGNIRFASIQNIKASLPSASQLWKTEDRFLGSCSWCHQGEEISRLGQKKCIEFKVDQIEKIVSCPHCGNMLQLPLEVIDRDTIPYKSSNRNILEEKISQIRTDRGKRKKSIFGSKNKENLSPKGRKLVKGDGYTTFWFEEKIGSQQDLLNLKSAIKEKFMDDEKDLEGALLAFSERGWKSLPALALAFINRKEYTFEEYAQYSSSPYPFYLWAYRLIRYPEFHKYELAETLLRKSLQLNPKYLPSLNELAGLLQGSFFRRDRDAEGVYLKITEYYPDNVDVHFSLGQLYHKKLNEPEKAKHAYQFALQRCEKNPDKQKSILVPFGDLLIETKNFVEAEICFEKASKIKSFSTHKSQDIFEKHGDSLRFQEKYKAAIKVYKKAIELEERNYMFWYKLGYTYHIIGDVKKAVDAFQKTLEYNFSDVELNIDVRLKLGVYFASKGKMEEAINMYEKIIEDKDDDPYIYNTLAYWMLMKGSPEKAIFLAEQAVDLAPDSPEIMHTLINILQISGNLTELQDQVFMLISMSTPLIGETEDEIQKDILNYFEMEVKKYGLSYTQKELESTQITPYWENVLKPVLG